MHTEAFGRFLLNMLPISTETLSRTCGKVSKGAERSPQTCGKVSRVAERSPRTCGKVSRVAERSPRTCGKVSRVAECPSRNRGKVSKIAESFSRTRGKVSILMGRNLALSAVTRNSVCRICCQTVATRNSARRFVAKRSRQGILCADLLPNGCVKEFCVPNLLLDCRDRGEPLKFPLKTLPSDFYLLHTHF